VGINLKTKAGLEQQWENDRYFVIGVKISISFVLGRGLSKISHAGDKSHIVMNYVEFYHFAVLEDGEKTELPSKDLKALVQS